MHATPAFSAPDLTTCARCGGSTAKGYWFLGGRAVHAACVDWSRRPFPYEWAIELSRRLIRKAPEDHELKSAGRLVWELGRRWPNEAPSLLERAAPAVMTITAADQRLRST